MLTSSLPAAEQRRLRERLATGSARLTVGTHALISEKVDFARLGLVVIDEQHRFGVVQRADLVAKGEHPDVLVMSATPIPRTLSMVLYGDLDVSVIDEKPPGRQPIPPFCEPPHSANRCWRASARPLPRATRSTWSTRRWKAPPACAPPKTASRNTADAFPASGW
ncbi:MAG: hypothetical protein Q9Q13_09265 [Acidobacteriota bacterium]|nr:hypothetical protein [Acidobacteriota bacterium]